LVLHVLGQLADFYGISWIALAFDSQALPITLHHQIDQILADAPVRRDSIAMVFNMLHQFTLEWRRYFLLIGFFQDAHEMAGIVSVFYQLPAQVAMFEVLLRVEGMDNPHLVPAPAGSDVEALFKDLLIAQAQGPALVRIDQRDENY